MWRFANQVYRAFRNSATHRCQQDILLPFPTACAADDEENSNRKTEKSREIPVQYNIKDVIKQNQFSPPDLEKIQNCLTNFAVQQFVNNYTREKLSKPIEEKKTILERDEICSKTIEKLSAIHEESLAEIHLQMGVDALENGDYVQGVHSLELSIENGRNSAAFYNLGLCYEEGLGVEQDRRKACEFYRQASLLGHVDAQLNLTRLSNHIDLRDDDDDDDEKSLSTVKNLSRTPSSPRRFDFESIDQFDEDFSFVGIGKTSSTAVCLSA